MPMSHHRLVASCLLALVANVATAQTIRHVGQGFFPDIQPAIDAASPGDVVYVDAGVYGSFQVDKSLVITAAPSALVQILAEVPTRITLLPHERVHLAGLDFQVPGIKLTGGIVSMERCTVRTDRSLELTHAILTMRWSAAGASLASGVLVKDSYLLASDSTFSTSASGAATIEHGAVKLLGDSRCQLALCTLIGAWPSNSSAPWPSVALHASWADDTARSWLADCNLQGGFHLSGPQGPALVARANGAPHVQLHRTQVSGYAIGNVGSGMVASVHTPVDMTIGSTFTTTMRGEPGHPLLFYVGIDVAGPVQIPEVAQPAFGFLSTLIYPLTPANAQGEADFSFVVPNNPSLRHLVLFWRGLDMVTLPWQAIPVFVTVVQ